MTATAAGPATPASRRKMGGATLLVAALIYGHWAALTLNAAQMPPLLVAALGGWLLAWQGSLQHETIHGHPTPWRRVNHLLGCPPLNLWLPYERYRALHMAHHATEHLTVPGHDPEARYLDGHAGPFSRLAARITATLLGRLTLGPPLEIAGFLATEAKAALADEPGVRQAWALHLVWVAAITAWLVGVCGLGLGEYLLCFVYPGAALSLLRSFAEHRADPVPGRRIAVVENAPLLGLLYLNNNLHAAHHAFPAASWRELPGLYATHRSALLAANGGLVYRGYGEVFRRFLLAPHDAVVHPQHGAVAPEAVA